MGCDKTSELVHAPRVFVSDGMSSPYMVFELMELGDLTQLLRNNDPQFGDKCEIQLGNVITIAY